MKTSGLLTLSGIVPSEEVSPREPSIVEGARDLIQAREQDEFRRPLTRYQREKSMGLRRSTGAMKLKKLTGRHMKIIQLHLAGWSGGAIAVQMNCSQETVSRILHDPLSQEIIQRAMDDNVLEIRALTKKAISAVREGLSEELPLTTRFGAINQLEKLQKMTGGESSPTTAEDLIQRLIESDVSFDLKVSKSERREEKDVTSQSVII